MAPPLNPYEPPRPIAADSRRAASGPGPAPLVGLVLLGAVAAIYIHVVTYVTLLAVIDSQVVAPLAATLLAAASFTLILLPGITRLGGQRPGPTSIADEERSGHG